MRIETPPRATPVSDSEPKEGARWRWSQGSLKQLRRRRAIGALAVATIAALNLIGAVLPRTTLELAQINSAVGLRASFAARSLLALLGCIALVLARGVRSGNRSAWALAIAVGTVSVVSQLLRDATFGPAAMCALAVVVLLVGWTSYRVPAAVRLRRMAIPAGLAALTIATIGLVEDLNGLPELTASGWSALVLRGLFFLPTGVQPTSAEATAYLDSLRVVGAMMWISLIVAAIGFARPSRFDRGRRVQSLRLMNDHGRHSSIPLAALPGNDLLQVDDSTVVGGRLVLGSFVAIGGPVSAEDDEFRSMSAFAAACERWGVVPAVVDAAPSTARAAERLGLTTLKIGEEAFIDLAEFSLAGKRRSNIRHSASRAEREGVSVVHYTSTCRTDSIDRELGSISDAWLANKHGPELGFTLGRLDLDHIDQQEVFVALNADGSSIAFVTWLPYDLPNGAVLDLMRRSDTAPPGIMELLISRSIFELRGLGYSTASLGGVPLASTSERQGALQHAMAWMYDHGGSVYEAKSLFAFKRKFDPRWEPIYLVYPSGTDLPRLMAAIGRSFFPSFRLWHRTP